MKEKNYSEYARYLVLSDNSNGKLKGTYIHYLNFKVVKELLSRISYTDKGTYSYETDIYKRKISSTEGKNILQNLDISKWNDTTSKILLVASQLKLQI
jgi:GTP cyclohydrolase FolE2